MSVPADIAFEVRCALRLVSAVFDLAPEAIAGPMKGPVAHVQARQAFCYLLHTEAEIDQTTISRFLGRHRSTVGHAVERIGELREEAELDEAFATLGEMFRELCKSRTALADLLA